MLGRFNTIPARFTGLAILFILIVSAAAGIIGVKMSLNYTEQRFHENFRVLASYLAKNAELGLLLKDEAMLKNLSENMLELDDIFTVKMMDASGNLLVKIGTDPGKSRLVTVKTPVTRTEQEEDSLFMDTRDKDRILGNVVVAYSLESLERLQSRMVYYVVGLILFFVALSSVCFFFLSRSVVLPLQGILRVSQAVSRGSMEVRAAVDGPGRGLREVRTLAAGFNNMLDALEREKIKREEAYKEMGRQKTLAEVGKFSMMVAHEVKNPLTVIKGSLAILKKDNLEVSMKQELIKYVEDDIQRINRIVEDFLLFARPRQPDYSETDMNRFIESVMDKFSFLKEGIEVETRIDSVPAVAQCDRALMERVINNIMTNAGSFAEQKITAATFIDQDKWHLEVTDDGPGIEPDRVSEVFNPFYTTRSRGTGLGLAIARDIVHLHNGTITAENCESGGARFTIIMETDING